jgi:hypothetical protein
VQTNIVCSIIFHTASAFPHPINSLQAGANAISNSNSNYLFQIRKLHMVLFKLEMIQANNKLFYTEKKLYN